METAQWASHHYRCKTRKINFSPDCTKGEVGNGLAPFVGQWHVGALVRLSRTFTSLIAALLLLLTSALLPLAAAAQSAPKPAAHTVLIVGDSLSAEYGLARGTGWVALLQKQLQAEKKQRGVVVVNASISGDTTSGGRSRLSALLARHQPQTVIIELGGNDALRGLPLDMTEKNLLAMVQASRKSGAKVLVLGMQVPPNYGSAYAKTFSEIFTKVAKAENTALVPFFLEGIADGDNPLVNFQADRIHPTEAAQQRMLANVWPVLVKLLP